MGLRLRLDSSADPKTLQITTSRPISGAEKEGKHDAVCAFSRRPNKVEEAEGKRRRLRGLQNRIPSLLLPVNFLGQRSLPPLASLSSPPGLCPRTLRGVLSPVFHSRYNYVSEAGRPQREATRGAHQESYRGNKERVLPGSLWQVAPSAQGCRLQ